MALPMVVEALGCLMFHRKIFVLLLLVKIKVYEFYWKIFELGPTTLQVTQRPYLYATF